MEIELRRRRISLISLGTGVIAFGVWSVTKTFLYFWVNPIDLSGVDVPPEYNGLVTLLTYVMIGFLMLAGLVLRLYVGLSARAEGMGKKKRHGYIAVGALLLVINLAPYPFILLGTLSARLENQARLDYYVSLFVDFTSLITLGDLLRTAIRARKLEKLLEG